MLLIKTYLSKSNIQGIGLFADQDISKGTVIWKYNSVIDIAISDDSLKSLSDASLSQINKYSYIDKLTGLRILCGDDARFFNHSEDPNCNDTLDMYGGVTFAIRDIKQHEELTCDYNLFCSDGFDIDNS